MVPRPADAGLLAVLSRLFAPVIEIEERPLPPPSPLAFAAIASALEAENRPPAEGRGEDDPAPAMNVVQDNALLAPLNPLGTVHDDVLPAGQIFVYVVRSGDTITAIAKSFGVSVNTILWANSISDIRALQVGDQLIILPVSGVRHEVKKGETVSAIAQRYRAGIEDILGFNGLAPDERLAVGSVVIIPNGELREATPLLSGPQRSSFAQLPLYEGYYLRPISGGRRSRGIHGYNGVDLAARCGLPVSAAADGQVLIVRSAGWNGGYGRYVVIAHGNGTQTLYGHLREISVSPGQTLRQGAVIGTIGSSGNSTGCHVHFEIRGAKNPF